MVNHDNAAVVEPVEALTVADAADIHKARRVRIVGRYLTVQAQAQELARKGVGVLCFFGLVGADRDEQHAVGPDAHSATLVVEPGRNVVQNDAFKRRATKIIGKDIAQDSADVFAVGIRDVHEQVELLIRLEFGVQEHVEQATFEPEPIDAEEWVWVRHANLQDRLGHKFPVDDYSESTRPLGNKHVARGQDGESPRDFEIPHDKLDIEFDGTSVTSARLDQLAFGRIRNWRR